MTDIDTLGVSISRSRVERGDHQWIARHFDAAAMSMEKLIWWEGRIMWCISGYEAGPTELYCIPAVRQFLAAWHRRTPYWLFFGSIETDNLKMMYLSLLRNVSVVRNLQGGPIQVSYERRELGRLLAHDLEAADKIYERLNFTPAERLTRIKSVLTYFGIEKETW